MRKGHNKLKLAKLAIKLLCFTIIIIAALWMIFNNNPQSLTISVNADKVNAEFAVNFASVLDDDGQ